MFALLKMVKFSNDLEEDLVIGAFVLILNTNKKIAIKGLTSCV